MKIKLEQNEYGLINDAEKLGHFQTLKEDECLTSDNLPFSQCV